MQRPGSALFRLGAAVAGAMIIASCSSDGSATAPPAATSEAPAITETTASAPSTTAAPNRPSEGRLEIDTDYEVNGTVGQLAVTFHSPTIGAPVISYGPGGFAVWRGDVITDDLMVMDMQFEHLAEVDAATGAPVTRTDLPADILAWLADDPSLEVLTPRSPITAGDAVGEVLVTRTKGLATATDPSFCAGPLSELPSAPTSADAGLGCFGLFVADDGSPWITYPGTVTEFAVFHVGPTDVLVMTERGADETGPSLLGSLRISAA